MPAFNHVDLKYRMNSSASLVWGASDSTRVLAILMNLGGIKGSAAALWMKFLVSASFLYRSEVEVASLNLNAWQPHLKRLDYCKLIISHHTLWTHL